MENLERTQDRLDRIRAIQPVLAALRTISLASWRLALGRGTKIQRYRERLARIGDNAASSLPDHMPFSPAPPTNSGDRPALERLAILIVGSERGLCGRYNAAVVERAEEHLAQEAPTDAQIEFMALGSRVATLLERRGHTLAWSRKLSLTSLPPFALAIGLTRSWLSRYELGNLSGASLVCNDYRGIAHYEPRIVQLIPPPRLSEDCRKPDGLAPIIETDAASLHRRLVEQLTAARLYDALIASAAAEHSTRYQLMDGAAQNAERLVNELTLTTHGARQQAITREMQELAAGAGLIGQRGS
jgi:F-type H+-transporting ATPase subunit gamma